MSHQKRISVIFVCMILMTATAGLSKTAPKTAADLIAAHQDAWYAATHHSFLDQVKDGTLPMEAFSTWLSQDYHFASTLLDSQCLVLMKSPRRDQNLLIGGLIALDSELSWFEENAAVFNIDLTVPVLPTAQRYNDFLLALQYKPYVVQVTAIWALEKAYFDSWSTALPCAPTYQEFVERWTSAGFLAYVEGLENAVDNAMAEASKKERAMAEVYFLWIVRYEKEFWDMALTGE